MAKTQKDDAVKWEFSEAGYYGQWPKGKPKIGYVLRIEDGYTLFAPLSPDSSNSQDVKVVGEKTKRSGETRSALYSLDKRAQSALTYLLKTELTDAAIIAFISEYGRLTTFTLWLSEVPLVELVEDTTQAPIYQDTFLTVVSAKERLAGNDRMNAECDFPAFAKWLRDNGYAAAADYAQYCLNNRDNLAKHLWLPEPIALYYWAAYHLRLLWKELAEDDISNTSKAWIAARMSETRVRFVKSRGKPGALSVRPTTLLSAIALEAVLQVEGIKPVQRKCPVCQKMFTVKHGNQTFCTPQHAGSHKKREQRRVKREASEILRGESQCLKKDAVTMKEVLLTNHDETADGKHA